MKRAGSLESTRDAEAVSIDYKHVGLTFFLLARISAAV